MMSSFPPFPDFPSFPDFPPFPNSEDFFNGNNNDQRSGTLGVGFQPHIDGDDIVKNGYSHRITTASQTITMMPYYSDKSLEELRWEDYKNGKEKLRNRRLSPGFNFASPPSSIRGFGSHTVSGATQQQPMAPNFGFGHPNFSNRPSMAASTSTQSNWFGGVTNASMPPTPPGNTVPPHTTHPLFGSSSGTPRHTTPQFFGQLHNPTNGNIPSNTAFMFGSSSCIPESTFGSTTTTPGPRGFYFGTPTPTPSTFGTPEHNIFGGTVSKEPPPSGFKFISGSDSSTPAKLSRSTASPCPFTFDAAKVNTEVPSTRPPQPIASSECAVTEPLQSQPQPTITTLASVAALVEANQLKLLAEMELMRAQIKELTNKQEQEQERGKDSTDMQRVCQRITEMEARCAEFAVLLTGRLLPGGGDEGGKNAAQTSLPESDHDQID